MQCRFELGALFDCALLLPNHGCCRRLDDELRAFSLANESATSSANTLRQQASVVVMFFAAFAATYYFVWAKKHYTVSSETL